MMKMQGTVKILNINHPADARGQYPETDPQTLSAMGIHSEIPEGNHHALMSAGHRLMIPADHQGGSRETGPVHHPGTVTAPLLRAARQGTGNQEDITTNRGQSFQGAGYD